MALTGVQGIEQRYECTSTGDTWGKYDVGKHPSRGKVHNRTPLPGGSEAVSGNLAALTAEARCTACRKTLRT